MIYNNLYILTVDVEDWFHLLDHTSTRTVCDWREFESRIHLNIDYILNLFDEIKQKATFFCLGWIAENYPEVIKNIDSRGHEIGSHSNTHQLVYELKQEEFKKDLYRSISNIQDLTGKKVKYFRAPGFSITNFNPWTFEVLVEQGIEVDSSIFPGIRAHGGFKYYGQSEPLIIKYNNYKIKEFPINFYSYFGKKIFFSGGGYFRLFPYGIINYWTKHSDYVMSYIHPRDFDDKQPIIQDLPIYRKFKSYYGIKGASKKLNRWLRDFDFINIKEAIDRVNWNNAPIIDLDSKMKNR